MPGSQFDNKLRYLHYILQQVAVLWSCTGYAHPQVHQPLKAMSVAGLHKQQYVKQYNKGVARKRDTGLKGRYYYEAG